MAMLRFPIEALVGMNFITIWVTGNGKRHRRADGLLP